MPLIGYVCPPGTATEGERHKVEYCLSQCPLPCVSPPLLAAMYEAERTNHHTGVYISASMLAGDNCARKTVYERTFDFYEHPTKRFWPFRGTHAHSIIERARDLVAPFGWLQEMRMAVPIKYPGVPAPVLDAGRWTGAYDTSRDLEIILGGTVDAYNPGIRELHDYKSMADVKAYEWYEYLVLGKTPPVVPPVTQKWMCAGCAFNGDAIPGERCHPKTEWAASQDVIDLAA